MLHELAVYHISWCTLWVKVYTVHICVSNLPTWYLYFFNIQYVYMYVLFMGFIWFYQMGVWTPCYFIAAKRWSKSCLSPRGWMVPWCRCRLQRMWRWRWSLERCQRTCASPNQVLYFMSVGSRRGVQPAGDSHKEEHKGSQGCLDVVFALEPWFQSMVTCWASPNSKLVYISIIICCSGLIISQLTHLFVVSSMVPPIRDNESKWSLYCAVGLKAVLYLSFGVTSLYQPISVHSYYSLLAITAMVIVQ